MVLAETSPRGFDWFEGGVVVSCQAPIGSPLRRPDIMAAMAQAAYIAGARGVRVEGPSDITAVRAAVRVPLIGLRKRRREGSEVFITATRADIDDIADRGLEVIAMDGTARDRPRGESLDALIAHAHAHGMLVLADLDDVGAAPHAIDSGADALATTLVPEGPMDLRPHGPNVHAVAAIRERFPSTPLIAEGRISTVSDIHAAFRSGATSVVIGTAITDALAIARGLIGGLEGNRSCEPALEP